MADEEDEGGGAESPKPVPYERFRETRAELRAAKAQIESLKGLEAQVAELPALRAELGRRDALLGLARGGILDDEGAEVALWIHSRIPEAERKPISEWVAGFRDKPESVPKPLAPYFATAPEKPAATEQRRVGPPGPAANTAGSSTISSEQVKAAFLKAQQSGKPEDTAEARRLSDLYRKGG
jgi:hypothetical protein